MFKHFEIITKSHPMEGAKLLGHILEKSVFDNVPERLSVLNFYQSKAYKIVYKMKKSNWFQVVTVISIILNLKKKLYHFHKKQHLT